MPDIKVKQNKKGTIKTLDKATVNLQKIKDNIITTKEKTKETCENNNDTGTEYATNKVTRTMSATPQKIYNTNKIGKNNLKQTTENIYKTKQKVDLYKRKTRAKRIARNMFKNSKNTVKTTKTAIKTADKTAKATKTTVKATRRAIQTAKATIKASIHGIKVAAKATVTAIKGIIAGTKALIAAIVAGGWVVIIIVIVICLIAMLCSSIFGIFFSSENKTDGRNMSSVITEINNEFITKITDIQKNTKHDEYDISANRAEWKDILAVYSAKVSKGKDDVELMTLSNERVQTLKEVFWDMNSISSRTEKVTKQITTTDENGNSKTENKEQTILHITITSKSVEEMTQMYNFNEKQKKQLSELLKEEYSKMWSGAIYGSSVESNDIVMVAKQQIGNIGGQPYWSWYGFSSRVEWCACFVSWCAEQCGYIERGIIPKFASVNVEGVPWFKTCGLWKERGFAPNAGDIIFFDWENDGSPDHVGIVEKTENDKVYTIEGNSKGDICKQKEYDINSNVIFGYGTPAY